MTCGQRVNHQKRHRLVYLVVAAATTVVVAVIMSSTLEVSELFLGPFSNSRPVAAMPILGNGHAARAVPSGGGQCMEAATRRPRTHCWSPSTFQPFLGLQESPVKYI